MSILRRMVSSQLVRGSILIFLANNAVNFGNFLYNLLMGRLLGKEHYGDLGATLSIFVLLGIPLSILSLSTIKLVSSLWGKRDIDRIVSLLNYLNPKLFIFSLALGGLFLLISPAVSIFLNLDSFLPLVLVAVYLSLSAPAVFNRSVLHGSLAFSFITLNSIVEISSKLLISTILVLLNFKLFGALAGPVIGGIVSYLLSIIELKFILKNKESGRVPKLPLAMTETTLASFFATLALTSFVTIDIIVVRHFFSAEISSEYTALTVMGKIGYYAVGPIIGVMFPIVASRASNGVPYLLPLFGTMAMSLGISLGVVFIYFLFPKLVINILFGSSYFGIIPYLLTFSFFITIYSINATLTYFLLSVSYYKPIYLLSGVTLLYAVALYLFHQTISQVVWVNILVSMLYLGIAAHFVWRKEKTVFTKLLRQTVPRGVYGV